MDELKIPTRCDASIDGYGQAGTPWERIIQEVQVLAHVLPYRHLLMVSFASIIIRSS